MLGVLGSGSSAVDLHPSAELGRAGLYRVAGSPTERVRMRLWRSPRCSHAAPDATISRSYSRWPSMIGRVPETACWDIHRSTLDLPSTIHHPWLHGRQPHRAHKVHLASLVDSAFPCLLRPSLRGPEQIFSSFSAFWVVAFFSRSAVMTGALDRARRSSSASRGLLRLQPAHVHIIECYALAASCPQSGQQTSLFPRHPNHNRWPPVLALYSPP